MNLENKLYIVLKITILNMIYTYVVINVEITHKNIFYLFLMDILYSVWTFLFNKLSINIKNLLVISINIKNFWAANFQPYNNYHFNIRLSIYPAIKYNLLNIKIKHIIKPNILAYEKFVFIKIRKVI